MTPTTSPLIVRSLICHQHVAMGIKCLSSLFRCSDRAIDLRLHDDGSLTPEDESRLKAAFPSVRLISRQEADPLVSERLRGLPKCREFRGRFISALKMFDTLLMADAPFLLLDTDVLFFHPFENLLDDSARDKALIYMEDYMYAYTLTPWEVVAYRELRPVYRLNSGMMIVRGERIDLAFVEYLLEKHPQFRRNWQVEQTIWGILAHRYGSRRWNTRQVTVVTEQFQPSPEQVAGHFVTLGRHRLDEFLDCSPGTAPNRRIRLQTEEPVVYGSAQLARDHLGNKIRNGLHRMKNSFRLPSNPA